MGSLTAFQSQELLAINKLHYLDSCVCNRGKVKNTYGTGCFLVLNTGTQRVYSQTGLLTTLACSLSPAEPVYALKGSVFVAGAAVQWLRDGLGIIDTASETADISRSVVDTAGVVVVPAFTGLGAPYWDTEARGAILGLTRGTKREHIVRATLEAIALQGADIAAAMATDAGITLKRLCVDGGATDFTSQLAVIAAADPDVVFIPGFVPESPLAVKQGKQAGIDAVFLGGDGWDNSELLRVGGDALEGSYFSTFFSANVPAAEASAEARRFIVSYINEYNAAPTGFAALGYDALRIVAEAMRRAGPDMSAEAIRAEIETTNNYSGATFLSGYNGNRHATKSAVIMTVGGGEVVYYLQVEP